MHIRILAVLLTAAALLTPAAVAAPSPPTVLCRVKAQAVPSRLPGIYTVVVTVGTTLEGLPCPPQGFAYVRLESGRVYPFRRVQSGSPAVYQGIPWYWRGVWRAASGRLYPVAIAGLRAPWNTPTP